MKKNIYKPIYGLLLISLLTLSLQPVAAKKKKAPSIAALAKDSLGSNDYGKIVKDGKKKIGLFTVIFKAKDNKLYFEMPDSAFQKMYMHSMRSIRTKPDISFLSILYQESRLMRV